MSAAHASKRQEGAGSLRRADGTTKDRRGASCAETAAAKGKPAQRARKYLPACLAPLNDCWFFLPEILLCCAFDFFREGGTGVLFGLLKTKEAGSRGGPGGGFFAFFGGNGRKIYGNPPRVPGQKLTSFDRPSRNCSYYYYYLWFYYHYHHYYHDQYKWLLW